MSEVSGMGNIEHSENKPDDFREGRRVVRQRDEARNARDEAEAEVARLRRQLEGAVAECERLREWIDAFGRESASIDVDRVLAASRERVPPTGGQ